MAWSAVDAPVEGPWERAGITVKCRREAPPELMETFWPLYEEAFGPLRTLAAARQVLTREEFAHELSDERVWKYIARDADGAPVGMTTLTDDLATVPWISPEYFAHHYPDPWQRRAVFYMPFSLVKPAVRNAPVFFAMLRPTVLRVASRRGVCAYDVCGHNDSTIRFGAGIGRLVRRLAEADVATVDVQTYYAVTFTGMMND